MAGVLSSGRKRHLTSKKPPKPVRSMTVRLVTSESARANSAIGTLAPSALAPPGSTSREQRAARQRRPSRLWRAMMPPAQSAASRRWFRAGALLGRRQLRPLSRRPGHTPAIPASRDWNVN